MITLTAKSFEDLYELFITTLDGQYREGAMEVLDFLVLCAHLDAEDDEEDCLDIATKALLDHINTIDEDGVDVDD